MIDHIKESILKRYTWLKSICNFKRLFHLNTCTMHYSQYVSYCVPIIPVHFVCIISKQNSNSNYLFTITIQIKHFDFFFILSSQYLYRVYFHFHESHTVMFSKSIFTRPIVLCTSTLFLY